MATTHDDDDDLLLGLGAIPEPDAEPTAGERGRARSFADIVDKTLAGHTPPAMSAEDRALLDIATLIRAAEDEVELAPERRTAIVEDALARALPGGRRRNDSLPPVLGGTPVAPAPVIPLASARRARLPWIISATSAVAAAAAIAIVLFRAPRTVRVEAEAPVPAAWRSRPADALIGPIRRERAGDAVARIDTIFADRLDGFRDRTLGGKP